MQCFTPASRVRVENDVDSDFMLSGKCGQVTAEKARPHISQSAHEPPRIDLALIQLSCSAVSADNFTAESSTPPSAQPTCEPSSVVKMFLGVEN